MSLPQELCHHSPNKTCISNNLRGFFPGLPQLLALTEKGKLNSEQSDSLLGIHCTLFHVQNELVADDVVREELGLECGLGLHWWGLGCPVMTATKYVTFVPFQFYLKPDCGILQFDLLFWFWASTDT